MNAAAGDVEQRLIRWYGLGINLELWEGEDEEVQTSHRQGFMAKIYSDEPIYQSVTFLTH